MGYYRSPEWRELLEAWDEWWEGVTEFINDEGQHRARIDSSTLRLVASLHDLTRLDPQPVWDLFVGIDGWHKRVRPDSRQQQHRLDYPIDRLWSMAKRVQLHQNEILRLAIVSDPGDLIDSPDGPAAVGGWRHCGITFEGLQTKPWLFADALFKAEEMTLHADYAYNKVCRDEHESDRDAVLNWYKRANGWFKSCGEGGIPWKITKNGDHYTLKNLACSREEPEANP